HLKVHPGGNRGVLWGKSDVYLTRRQVAEWLHQDVYSFPKQAWLYKGYQYRGQHRHRTPWHAHQSALTHHGWCGVLLHLSRRMVVQGPYQIEGNTVRIRPREHFRIEL